MIYLFFTERHEYAWTVDDNKHGASEWAFVRRLEDCEMKRWMSGRASSPRSPSHPRSSLWGGMPSLDTSARITTLAWPS